MSTAVVETEQALRVERIDSLAALEEIASAWDGLEPTVPFLTHPWALAWWHHYQRNSGTLFTLVVRDAVGVIGLAPWHRQDSARRGRVVRFLGSGEVCADYVSLVAAPENQIAVATAIADWLAGPGASQWDMLELDCVENTDEVVACLHDRLAERGHATHRSLRWQGWRTELPATWDAYLESLSKTRRNTARTQVRKFVDTGRVQLRRAETPADVSRSFDILVDLHQKRRGMKQQPGCFASPSFTAFHRELAERFLAAGRLRMSWLELDGTPIAIEYSFTGGDTVYYYQGGFDPTVSQLGPGWLMSALSLRAAIAEGYQYFDFLRGDEPYKASWNALSRTLVDYRIAGRHPAARVRHAAWKTSEVVRRWAAERWPVAANSASPAAEGDAAGGPSGVNVPVGVCCRRLATWLSSSGALPLAKRLAGRRRA